MRFTLRTGWAVILFCAFTFGQKSSVVTVAGGYQGNHKPALAASFALPSSVAFDSAGTLYVADSDNCEIRKINKNGAVEVFAGTGICGFSGDGGKASSAMLSGFLPSMVFDGAGNLLIGDSGNFRVRRITPAGMISTIAGTGINGYSGDGGPATQAQISDVRQIALDAAGDLYLADTNNFVVRKIDSAGIISSVAGDPSAPFGFLGEGGPATAAQLGFLQGVAVDASGNLYIGDGYSHVRKVDTAGIINTIAGNGQSGSTGDGGPGTAAALGSVLTLQLNGGTLYIGSFASVWSLDLSTDTIHLLAGASGVTGFGGDGGSAYSAAVNQPEGLALDSQGNLFVADAGNNRVREIAAGTIATVAGGYIGDGHKGTEASLDFASLGNHITFDASGNLYIADVSNHRIRKLSTKGVISTIAGNGTSGYSGDGGPATSAQLFGPSSVAVDSTGNIFIADTGNGVVRKVDTAGNITTLNVQNSITFYPFRLYNQQASVAIDSAGNLYVCDAMTVVWKIDLSGNATVVAGTPWGFGYSGDGGPATQATFLLPAGISVDGAGNLYIADWLNERVRKVDTAGIITTLAGNGTEGFSGDGGPAASAELNLPQDVVADSAGNVYIADWINLRIRVVDPSGTIHTVAGSGGGGYNGERLSPLQTNMLPIALAFDPNGQLYFTDSGAQRVRTIGK